jgi:hypothetical protein
MSTNDDRVRRDLDPPDERPGGLAASLPTVVPPPHLESRVADTLTGRGLLAPPARRAGRPLWRVARALVAAAIVFVAGAVAGRMSVTPQTATPAAARFVLLLYDGDGAGGGADEATRIDEHRRWARELAERGRSVSGEKLGPSARQLGPSGVTPALRDSVALGGFFIISAKNTDDAVAVARTSPLLRHGGRIVVRPIDPT